VTPDQFINKWQGVTLKERSAAQEHFLDLCRLLDEPTPAESDPNGTYYYGPTMPDEEVLRHLLALNLARASDR
jgi:hypothetical protein